MERPTRRRAMLTSATNTGSWLRPPGSRRRPRSSSTTSRRALPVLHYPASGAAEAPTSAAPEAPSEQAVPDMRVFQYLSPDGKSEMIGMWSPAARDDSPQGVVKAAVSVTADPETAERWRAELAAWQDPTGKRGRALTFTCRDVQQIATAVHRSSVYVRSSFSRLARAREYHVSSSERQPCHLEPVSSTERSSVRRSVAPVRSSSGRMNPTGALAMS